MKTPRQSKGRIHLRNDGQVIVESILILWCLAIMGFGITWLNIKKWELLKCHHQIFLKTRALLISTGQTAHVSRMCDGKPVNLTLPTAEDLRGNSLENSADTGFLEIESIKTGLSKSLQRFSLSLPAVSD